MTKNIKRVSGILMAMAMGIAMTSSTAYARSAQLIRFKLPKATTVKGITMPAGNYTVTDMGMWSGLPILQIRSDDSKRQVIAFAHMEYSTDLQAADRSVATFSYDGNAYRLQSIRIAGTNLSYHISPDLDED